MDISGKFCLKLELLFRNEEFIAAMLACCVQFVREKIMLPRSARLPIKWTLVLQQMFCRV